MYCEFLSAGEIHQLTGRRGKRRQIKALTEMGLKFVVRPDGLPIVPRAQFRGYNDDQAPIEPDWSALDVPEKTTATQ